MNRYFWLLIRFIGEESEPAERRVIYDRARTALETQLFSAAPPLDPGHVAYERRAFEEAVRTIESCIARWGVARVAEQAEAS